MKILRFVGVSRFRRLKPSVSALLLMCLLAALPLPAFAAKKIIFDTDPGSDDALALMLAEARDRKSTRLNSSHVAISYAVFCLKKKKKTARIMRICEFRSVE